MKSWLAMRAKSFDVAVSTIIDLYKFSRLIRNGGGDIEWYARSNHGLCSAISLSRELIFLSPLPSIVDSLLATLSVDTYTLSGYLDAMLSDFFRDIIVTFTGTKEVSQDFFHSPFFATAYLRAKGYSLADVDELQYVVPDGKINAIMRVVGNNSRAFNATETVSWISESYEQWTRAFNIDLAAQMIVPESASRPYEWPDEFSLTLEHDAAITRQLIDHATSTVGSLENAVGLLIFEDVRRVANSIAQRLIIMPWRSSIEIESLRTSLAILLYRQRYNRNPQSVLELTETGIITDIPIDRLVGTCLEYKPDKNLIVGPTPEMLHQAFQYPFDAPKAIWAVPI
ncbi:MAG: hypothetical protein IT427_02415 [Pirellulales bacterium]|nr:hypothetical protein [Pirellulales bacterium]